jgi:hypothetical protein
MEAGTVVLTNARQYPFNDSRRTVALRDEIPDGRYTVITELSCQEGEAGDICVTDKAVNGFKIEYTGSGASATVRYSVLRELFDSEEGAHGENSL